MPHLDSTGQKKEWKHVPDVLVFRQGYIPQLYQIKESPDDPQTKTFERCNKRCHGYAKEKGWVYSVIYPKTMPVVIQSNINLLHGFLKQRKTYIIWQDQVLMKLEHLAYCSILDLARSFSSFIDYRVILPVIYHLIAKGHLSINLSQAIDEKQIVKKGNLLSQLNQHFQEEVGTKNEAS